MDDYRYGLWVLVVVNSAIGRTRGWACGGRSLPEHSLPNPGEHRSRRSV